MNFIQKQEGNDQAKGSSCCGPVSKEEESKEESCCGSSSEISTSCCS
ncbi:hypothetical protein [Heyndrickxia shackletonii]|nr:hypothetical protein [Heyndrickxia shackletonii]NEY98654.1 hypothetical protein [Heyndrickxia shackletonii]